MKDSIAFIVDGRMEQDIMLFSEDDGKTWSEPKRVAMYGNFLSLGGGRVMVYGAKGARAPNPEGRFWLFFSDDGGASWRIGGVQGGRTDESTVLELADGALYLNMRNYHRKHPCRSTGTSADAGLTWSKPAYDEALIEPVCPVAGGSP
jgi:sialidase-1